MEPTDGVDHVTAVFEAPATVAENAADCPFVSETHVGATEILTTGSRVTFAESTGRPGLDAKILTVLDAVMVAGA
jgi:hypothetical protein